MNSGITEYTMKVRLYLDNHKVSDEYHYRYNIYKFKCNNRIKDRMMSGVNFFKQQERNTNLIIDLMIRIDYLLYEAVLDQAAVQLHLSEFHRLVLGYEVVQYKSKVQRYIDNYGTWRPIDRLLQNSNIYF